jgi:hypothetical protein
MNRTFGRVAAFAELTASKVTKKKFMISDRYSAFRMSLLLIFPSTPWCWNRILGRPLTRSTSTRKNPPTTLRY